jgi:tetratricopeptide (TPR) repeat protein
VLAGFDAWRQGNSEDAASHLLGVVGNDRDNVEAWFQLGETLFHYNPVRGRPVAEARDAFGQVLRLDPDHWGALWHLGLLDGLQGRTADLDRRMDHLLQLGPATDYRLEIAVVRACAHRDGVALARQADALRATGDGRLQEIAWRCAVYGRDLDGTEAIARLLLERHDVAGSTGAGRLLLATLEMARGRRERAWAQLDSLGPPEAGTSLGPRTEFALLPLAETRPDSLEELAREWRRRPEEPPGWNAAASWDEVRVTSLGRLEAALGRPDEARQWAARMEDVADPPSTRRLSHAVALGIRAEAAAAAGDTAEALERLEDIWPHVWFGILVSHAPSSQAWARFDRAAVLEHLGRYQEAFRWYGTVDELSAYDLVYAPAAHFRRAAIYERLGDSASAASEYSRFLELWKEADPDLQHWVILARERLTRLSTHR